MEALYVKMKRPHSAQEGLNSPFGIGLAEADCMCGREKQKKNSSYSIKHGRFHSSLQK